MFKSSLEEPENGSCLYLPLPDTLLILIPKPWVTSLGSVFRTEIKGGASFQLFDSQGEPEPWEQL